MPSSMTEKSHRPDAGAIERSQLLLLPSLFFLLIPTVPIFPYAYPEPVYELEDRSTDETRSWAK